MKLGVQSLKTTLTLADKVVWLVAASHWEVDYVFVDHPTFLERVNGLTGLVANMKSPLGWRGNMKQTYLGGSQFSSHSQQNN